MIKGSKHKPKSILKMKKFQSGKIISEETKKNWGVKKALTIPNIYGKES